MKIRNGFVSNSSSSSFVVAFPREPKSVKDVKEILFVKGQSDYPNPFVWEQTPDDEAYWPVWLIADVVWKDIQKNGVATKEDIIESLDGGWFEGLDELMGHVDEFSCANRDEYWKKRRDEIRHLDWSTEEGREKHQKLWKDISDENEKRATKIVEKFMEKNPDATFYVFEYSSAMEHGTLFRRVKHIKTSKH